MATPKFTSTAEPSPPQGALMGTLRGSHSSGMSLALKPPSPHRCHSALDAEHPPALQHHPRPQTGWGWEVVRGLLGPCQSELGRLCWLGGHMPATLQPLSPCSAGLRRVMHVSRQAVQARGCQVLATELPPWTLAAWADGMMAARSCGGICCPDCADWWREQCGMEALGWLREEPRG